MRTPGCMTACVTLLSLLSFVPPSQKRTMAQEVSEDVVPVECSASSMGGFDFMVQPALGFALHWSLSSDFKEIMFKAVLEADLPGWLGIGFSSDGSMVGSDAVVGVPSQGTALEYDLDSVFVDFIEPSAEQEISEVFVERASGSTSLGFKRPANPIGEGKLSLPTIDDESAILLWAFGPEDTLGYHFEGRGAISLDLLCLSSADDVNTGSPTPSPIDGGAFTASPTSSPTAANPAFLFLDAAREAQEDDTSGAVRAVPKAHLLARRTSTSGLGGWAGSVGAVFGLAIGLFTAAMATK